MPGADLGKDLAMLDAGRLGPDLRDADLIQRQHGQHARLQIRADTDHRARELVHAELT